jgi:hypothetical protein
MKPLTVATAATTAPGITRTITDACTSAQQAHMSW